MPEEVPVTIVYVCQERFKCNNEVPLNERAKVTDAGLNNKDNVAAMVRYLETPCKSECG
jgi:hypothetical protein